jgi:nicotinate phosphoribosyltransferase
VAGTQAHSWIQVFDDELTAFRRFVELYPEQSILLVDTYDTLRSGVPNAITVGLEMRQRGERLLGVRLDSGDLAYLSIETRKLLDAAGLSDTRIVCSGDLDEYLIRDLRNQGARIDTYGVGTHMVTAEGEPALSGVYKLAAVEHPGGGWESRRKRSDGAKASLPGVKQVWRLRDASGEPQADLIELEGEQPRCHEGVWGYHPTMSYQKKLYRDIKSAEALLEPVMRDGETVVTLPTLQEIRQRVREQLASLHPTFRRIVNPHIYKVSLGERMQAELERLRRAGYPEV